LLLPIASIILLMISVQMAKGSHELMRHTCEVLHSHRRVIVI
jgi:hypothetical protein